MASTAMGSSAPHTTRERGRVALDGTGEARLVPPPLLDVADEAGQQQVAVEVGDHRPLGGELVGRRPRLAGLKVAATPAVTVRRSSGASSGSRSVGQLEEEALPGAELGQLDVDAAVGHHRSVISTVPAALELAGQQLPADGVAHVVGQQGQPVHAQRSRRRPWRCRPGGRRCRRGPACRTGRSRACRRAAPGDRRPGGRPPGGSRTTRSGTRGGRAGAGRCSAPRRARRR